MAGVSGWERFEHDEGGTAAVEPGHEQQTHPGKKEARPDEPTDGNVLVERSSPTSTDGACPTP